MAISVVPGCSFGAKLCKALGIDGQGVKSITIEVDAEAFVSIKMEKFANKSEGEALLDLFKDYQLREVTPNDQSRI